MVTPHPSPTRDASGLRVLAPTLVALALAACDDGATQPPPRDATIADARDAAPDHVEPAPGTPGGRCSDAGPCPANTQCNGSRCAWCGGLGELPCASGCREGSPRWGVCFRETTPPGTLGGLCQLEDCDPGTCTVPNGSAFVCFACGAAAGQPCCPVVGCTGPGLRCDDGVCH